TNKQSSLHVYGHESREFSLFSSCPDRESRAASSRAELRLLRQRRSHRELRRRDVVRRAPTLVARLLVPTRRLEVERDVRIESERGVGVEACAREILRRVLARSAIREEHGASSCCALGRGLERRGDERFVERVDAAFGIARRGEG